MFTYGFFFSRIKKNVIRFLDILLESKFEDFFTSTFSFHICDLGEIFTNGIGTSTGRFLDIFTHGSESSRKDIRNFSREGFFFTYEKNIAYGG